ncbi:hypothetical protein FMM05_06265 [Flavobacterium zepuense]|uniref:Lipoprotein n=1 Tax=Flavobacterium zepuense TaxID=2593302 RepID=A0A552V5S8_9FLAO|nr:hypothetical protein [Flavobacterium zepuense]TRW25823.1 hypothetical protein FMM05_06265 [Flavobacterium zepuense]
MKTIIYIAALSCFFLFVSCNEKQTEVNSDVALLKKMIKLDMNPLSVKFTYKPVGRETGIGPADYSLTAIVQLSVNDLIRLQKYHQQSITIVNEQYSSDIFADVDWYTPAVQQSFSKQNGYVTINTATYPADYFSKGSLINGFCFFTKNNEVFIYLHTT